MSINSTLGFTSISLQCFALIAVSVSTYFLITKTQEILRGNRVGQHIEKMETYHENLIELSNSYIIATDEELAADLLEKMRNTLARLTQNKNNWVGFLYRESRSTVGLYAAALDHLDNTLGDIHNAEDLSPFLKALADFGRRRECVSHETNRQFFGVEEPNAQCQEQEEVEICAQAPGPPLVSRQRRWQWSCLPLQEAP